MGFLKEVYWIPTVLHGGPRGLKSPRCTAHFGFLTASHTRGHRSQHSVCQALEANPHTRPQAEIPILNLRPIYQRSHSAGQMSLLCSLEPHLQLSEGYGIAAFIPSEGNCDIKGEDQHSVFLERSTFQD